MGTVTRLWNTRNHNALRRHWASFAGQIIVEGDHPEHAGVLSVLPDDKGGLCVRLRVFGGEFAQFVSPGEDISIRIHGLTLFICVKAVEDTRMLVAFGVSPESPVGVKVTLDEGASFIDPATLFVETPALLHDYPN